MKLYAFIIMINWKNYEKMKVKKKRNRKEKRREIMM